MKLANSRLLLFVLFLFVLKTDPAESACIKADLSVPEFSCVKNIEAMMLKADPTNTTEFKRKLASMDSSVFQYGCQSLYVNCPIFQTSKHLNRVPSDYKKQFLRESAWITGTDVSVTPSCVKADMNTSDLNCLKQMEAIMQKAVTTDAASWEASRKSLLALALTPTCNGLVKRCPQFMPSSLSDIQNPSTYKNKFLTESSKITATPAPVVATACSDSKTKLNNEEMYCLQAAETIVMQADASRVSSTVIKSLTDLSQQDFCRSLATKCPQFFAGSKDLKFNFDSYKKKFLAASEKITHTNELNNKYFAEDQKALVAKNEQLAKAKAAEQEKIQIAVKQEAERLKLEAAAAENERKEIEKENQKFPAVYQGMIDCSKETSNCSDKKFYKKSMIEPETTPGLLFTTELFYTYKAKYEECVKLLKGNIDDVTKLCVYPVCALSNGICASTLPNPFPQLTSKPALDEYIVNAVWSPTVDKNEKIKIMFKEELGRNDFYLKDYFDGPQIDVRIKSVACDKLHIFPWILQTASNLTTTEQRKTCTIPLVHVGESPTTFWLYNRTYLGFIPVDYKKDTDTYVAGAEVEGSFQEADYRSILAHDRSSSFCKNVVEKEFNITKESIVASALTYSSNLIPSGDLKFQDKAKEFPYSIDQLRAIRYYCPDINRKINRWVRQELDASDKDSIVASVQTADIPSTYYKKLTEVDPNSTTASTDAVGQVGSSAKPFDKALYLLNLKYLDDATDRDKQAIRKLNRQYKKNSK